MKSTPYKLNPSELRHGWHKLDKKVRDAVVKRNLAIIEDPTSTSRAVGIATKNLIAINQINIQLDNEAPQQTKLEINIIESD